MSDLTDTTSSQGSPFDMVEKGMVERLERTIEQQADRIEQQEKRINKLLLEAAEWEQDISKQEKEIAEWKGKYEWAAGKLKEAAEDEQ